MSKTLLKHVTGAAGLDEAGRGPLAGPVVAAAVVLPDGFDLEGIDDSKKLTSEQREELAERIQTYALWSIAFVESTEIDSLNILWASMAAMERALETLPGSFESIYVDGNCLPKKLRGKEEVEAVVKGDGEYACIAAASILAKTARDRRMAELSHVYPGYGFEKHFGYPTPEHLAALREIGPCDIHRRSFTRIAEMVLQPVLF